MSERLCEATLGRLPSWVRQPAERPAPRVVHIGIGAFHRAHQAAVFEDLGWGIAAASLRSPAVRDAMAPQDFLYSLVAGDDVRVIGAVRDVLLDHEALVERMASPETDIVTLTVTEKGYLPGALPAALLARGLALRHQRGLRPFTAISCDNLAHNGAKLREAVLAASRGAARDWIAAEGAFPQTMVDRIVPATDEADIAALVARTGLVDRAMVKTEPFTQWVIEDQFAGERPDFQAAGVQITRAVASWEEAKLRLLNGAHSPIAYLGGLAGIAFVHEVVALPDARRMIEALWDEAQQTLSPPPELDIAAYRRALMSRFANPALQHRTHQIAMDGSQKLPQRLVAPLLARRDMGLTSPMLSLAIAAWMRWGAGRDDDGTPHAIDDPLADRIQAAWIGVRDPIEAGRRLLAIEPIFPPSLAADAQTVAPILDWLERLTREGAAATLRAA